MKNSLTLLEEIKSEYGKTSVASKLPLILNELNVLLLKIRFSANLQEANLYFDLLDQIQLVTATLQHNYGIELPSNLKQFIKDFDLLHEVQARKRLFNEIKKGIHCYETNNDIIVSNLLTNIENKPISGDISLQLQFLYNEIQNLISKVKKCTDIQGANTYFDLLQRIQDVLAEQVFKYELDVSPALRKFIRDCDRLDDDDLRKYLFNEINNDRYIL